MSVCIHYVHYEKLLKWLVHDVKISREGSSRENAGRNYSAKSDMLRTYLKKKKRYPKRYFNLELGIVLQ